MGTVNQEKSKVAIVFGMLPSVEEVDQFQLLDDQFDLTVISSESIVGYLSQNSFFKSLKCVPLPDHDESPNFLPGLEKVLENFDTVIVKERIGVYAYQVVKAKWKYQFHMITWIDNLTVLPADDVNQMKTIRTEVMNASDLFLVQSKSAQDILICEGIPKEKIKKVAPWVRSKASRTEKTKARALEAIGCKDGDILILCYGQVEWEEGLLELFHGVKQLKESDRSLEHRLKIAVYGIGSFATEIKIRSLILGIDRDIIYLAPSRDSLVALTEAASFLYLGTYPSRDRIDGDPFRIIHGMKHKIPLLAARSPLVDEFVGKHRLDFCLGSIASIKKAIIKGVQTKSLVNNIVEKNSSRFNHELAEEEIKGKFTDLLTYRERMLEATGMSSIDEQVSLIESRVAAKEYIAAIELIEKAFQSTDLPNHHKANLYRLIGDCFTKMNDFESGKNSYIQAIELDPYSAKAHIGLGTVSLTRGNHNIGVIHFQKAVSLAPNDEMANLGLGLSFHGLDELGEAKKWVKKSLEINPENTASLYTLVRISQEMEQYDFVEDHIRAYLRLHPHDHNMLYTLGGICFKLEKYEDVLEVMKEIISMNPMDVRAQSLVKQARRAIDKRDSQSNVG